MDAFPFIIILQTYAPSYTANKPPIKQTYAPANQTVSSSLFMIQWYMSDNMRLTVSLYPIFNHFAHLLARLAGLHLVPPIDLPANQQIRAQMTYV